MLGSIINAFSSLYKADDAQKKVRDRERDQRELDAQRPQYNGAALAAQSVNPLYDKNINLAKSYEPLSKVNNLPGQAYMQSRIDNNAANSIAQAGMAGFTSPSQYVQMLAAAASGQRQAQTDFSLAGAENRMDNQDRFVSALSAANTAKSEEQDKAWNQNVWEPYAQKVNRNELMLNDWRNKREQYRTNQQASGSQAAQDSGNFMKSFSTKGMGGGGENTQQTVQAAPASQAPSSMERSRARYQGTDTSWQKRGRGY